jgi:hypothetical protein
MGMEALTERKDETLKIMAEESEESGLLDYPFGNSEK